MASTSRVIRQSLRLALAQSGPRFPTSANLKAVSLISRHPSSSLLRSSSRTPLLSYQFSFRRGSIGEYDGCKLRSSGYASTSSAPFSATDPTLDQAHDLIEQGTKELEEGNLDGAKKYYEQSVNVKETSGAWFNLGVCEYHLKNNAAAIKAWENSVKLQPSADAYTNMASAYVLAQPPQPALAIKHLTSALEMAPNDPEIAFNLAAVLESTDNLETALKMYEKAQKGGIERASQNVRNVGAKILAKAAKAAESHDRERASETRK